MRGEEEARLIAYIEARLPEARQLLRTTCPFHPLNDVISDYEAALDGQPTLYPGSRLEVLHAVAEALELSLN